MNKEIQPEATLIGLSLQRKTTNKNNQSAKDCGMLWQQFETGNYFDKIPNKLTVEILAVYHDYEGDHTQPYSYFIGCKVASGTQVPEGLDSLQMPGGLYTKIVAHGKMPDCVGDAWRTIWNTDYPRAYKPDYEVYDERCADWNNAEVDIYLSITE